MLKSLTEIKGDKALDVLAEIFEPVVNILNDPEVKEADAESHVKAIAVAVKNHKKDVKTIVSAIDEKKPDEINLVEIPARLYQVFNDTAVKDLFTSQGQKIEDVTFGSATETTEANEK